MTTRPFRSNRLLHGLILWLVILWVITAIGPFNRRDWLLENLLVFIYVGLLIATYRRFAFTNLSYMLFGGFISLHLIGAHYTYSEVPFGFWLKDTFNLTRNHYDRIIHFSYGLLNAYPMRDILMRSAGVRPNWSISYPLLAYLGLAAFMSFWRPPLPISSARNLVISISAHRAISGMQRRTPSSLSVVLSPP